MCGHDHISGLDIDFVWVVYRGLYRYCNRGFKTMTVKPDFPCPHLQGDRCNHPDSQIRNRAFWLCEAVKGVRSGCPMKEQEIIEKESVP